MRNTKFLVLCGVFAALTAAGAFIQIPMWPAPITLQTMFSAMAGIILGAKYGAISQLIYVLLGLIGIPVFTKGGGIGYVLQPTFGFLLGLAPSTLITGYLYNKTKNFKGAVISILSGYALLYAIGVPYLMIIVNYVSGIDMSFSKALYSGMLLFLPGDIIKAVIVSFVSIHLPREFLSQTS